MKLLLQHSELTIEVFDDSAFTGTADSPTSYHKIIQDENAHLHPPNTQHGIKVYKNESLINSAIIVNVWGGTGVHDGAAFIDEGNLIIRCSRELYSLSLPDLNIVWQTEVDPITCFSVYKYQDGYITYGELSISRIDRTGKILWSFDAEDIFVCLDERKPFEMFEDHIALTDFNGKKYRIDYNGQIVSKFRP